MIDTPDQLRAGLVEVLQETDLRRPLDSLDTTVVLAYLIRHGLRYPEDQMDRCPRTIEGWLTWADRPSPAS